MEIKLALLNRLQIEHGVSAFNAPSSDGLSIFHKAFVERDREMMECIMRFAEEHGCLLALEWTETSTGEVCNVLDKALQTKTVDYIEDALRLVCSTVTPFRNGAAIAKNSFQKLVESNLEIVERALADNSFVTPVCDFEVHVDFLAERSKLETAEHIGTADTYLDWKHTTDQDAVKRNWRKENEKTIQKMEAGGNKSTTSASLQFVRVEDAAKPGMDGIIRPLLLKNVPARFFEFDVTKWVVQFKWSRIWKQRFIKDAALYALFLVLFTVYAESLSRIAVLSKANIGRKVMATVFLAISVLFGLRMAVKETTQLLDYMKDSEVQSNNLSEGRRRDLFSVGLRHYFSFAWNRLDIASCLLLLAVILPLHLFSLLHEGMDELLSAAVAIEALVVYAKVSSPQVGCSTRLLFSVMQVLYFCQPFRCTGPLVRMIAHIVWDSIPFLFLSSNILFGFGVALPVMLRAQSNANQEVDKDGGDDSDIKSDIKNDFGRLDRSVVTLFCAMLGNFDKEARASWFGS